MELVKEKWQKSDIEEFQTFLESQGNPAKEEWAANILQTSLPVLAMKTKEMYTIISQIAKGNYLSFIDLWIWKYYENTAIIGSLINKIEDFPTFKSYLDIYSPKVDNWASCDLLTFTAKGSKQQYMELAKAYSKSELPFRRRIGMSVLFKFIMDDEYIDEIFNMLDGFYDETEYYVNMMNAWLFCECFIKQKDKTVEYLKHHNLNRFTINKGIQKCRDSYRVSQQDKDYLVQYRVKRSKKADE